MFEWQKKSDYDIVQQVVADNATMKQDREYDLDMWDIITRIYSPRSKEQRMKQKKGSRMGQVVYSDRPALAHWKHVYGMTGYMVSPSVPWMQVRPIKASLNNVDAIKEYTQSVDDQVASGFNRSNFYEQNTQHVSRIKNYGNSALVPDIDIKKDRVVFQAIPHNEVLLQRDHLGVPNVFHRDVYYLTSVQMLEKFGDKTPAKIKDEVIGENNQTRKPFNKHPFIYAIYPNDSRLSGGLHNLDKPFIEFYILLEQVDQKSNTLISKQGRDWFPIIGDENLIVGNTFGQGLSERALTAALMDNSLGEAQILGAHKSVEGAVRAHSDFRAEGVSLNPKARNYAEDKDKFIEVIEQRIKWPISDAQMARFNSAIDEWHYIRFFEMLTSQKLPQMTAYQISKMLGEKAILMGSLTGDYENTTLSPAIKIIWHYERIAGRIESAPEQLVFEGGTQLEFTGPLPQMQKALLRGRGIQDSIGMIQAIGGIFPQSVDVIKGDELMEGAVSASGLAQKYIRTKPETIDFRAQVAAFEQANQIGEKLEQVGKGIESMSKPIADNSPLALVAGGAA